MRTLERFIAATYLKNFFLAAIALSSLYLSQALLGDLVDGDYPASQLIYYHLLDFPTILVQMIPAAVLVSTVMTISGLNRTNELVACYSIGFGLSKLVAILLTLVFMISCLSLILQDSILPPVYKKRTNFYWREMKKKPDFFLDVKKDKIWYRSKNLIYNLRTFEPKTNRIKGMSIYTFDEGFNLLQVVESESAVYTAQGWRLEGGTVTLFPTKGSREEALDPFPLTKTFKEKSLVIPETPKDFQEIEKEVDSLRIRELYRFIKRVADAGSDTKAYEVKFHSKISLSFISLVMCVLGIPFSGRNRREGGLAKDLGVCLLITFFYWLFYSVGLSLGQNGTLPPIIAAWLPSAIFAGFAGMMIYSEQRNG